MSPKRSGPLADPGLGRMLLISFVLHIAVAVLFSGVLAPKKHRQLTHVIEVDLFHLPVADPQAGRPDGSPRPQQAAAAPPRPAPRPATPPPPPPRPEPAPAPAPVAAPPPKPEPAPAPAPKPPEPKPAPQPPKPEPKVAAKPPEPPQAPKPAQVEPAPKPQAAAPPADQTAVNDAIERMRRQRERDELRERLAALATQDSRGNTGSNIPLGVETGTGTQAGVDYQTWIQAYLKENWNLSEYQVGGRRDLEAEVRIIYDSQGTLLDYTFTKPSGEAVFDDSVRRAILNSRQLPFKPERRLEIPAKFNLKDLRSR